MVGKQKTSTRALDIAIANITAESVNFWLIKFVKEQSWILRSSKFTACVFFLKNIEYSSFIDSFVVSVAVLLINIHKSRAVTLYLIKHRILIRGGFIGSFENEALENEHRSTKHPNLENEAPKSRKRSTQNSKTKHPKIDSKHPKLKTCLSFKNTRQPLVKSPAAGIKHDNE